jgi:catechol 2,3-dioxygenase-like lactoylglutathione lyase family enzyme
MAEGHTSFWLAKKKVGDPTHLAFRARSRAVVDRFYDAALAAGGEDNGKPGLRKENGPNYYAAFVHDPDGHNIEAVSFAKASARTKSKAKATPRGKR